MSADGLLTDEEMDFVFAPGNYDRVCALAREIIFVNKGMPFWKAVRLAIPALKNQGNPYADVMQAMDIYEGLK